MQTLDSFFSKHMAKLWTKYHQLSHRKSKLPYFPAASCRHFSVIFSFYQPDPYVAWSSLFGISIICPHLPGHCSCHLLPTGSQWVGNKSTWPVQPPPAAPGHLYDASLIPSPDHLSQVRALLLSLAGKGDPLSSIYPRATSQGWTTQVSPGSAPGERWGRGKRMWHLCRMMSHWLLSPSRPENRSKQHGLQIYSASDGLCSWQPWAASVSLGESTQPDRQVHAPGPQSPHPTPGHNRPHPKIPTRKQR